MSGPSGDSLSARAKAGLHRHADWVLTGSFVASRLAVRALGVEFRLDLAWMFLADPVQLRERLGETLLYFHAFPPGMNLLTGLLSKAAASGSPTLAPWVFAGCGLIMVLALRRLLEGLGLTRAASVGVAFAASLTPAALYFENLYLYTYPCAALLTLGLVLFHRACRRGTALAWLGFFLASAGLGWLRTTFHLSWFALMLGVALALSGAGKRRQVVVGAAAPALLLLSIYLKNLALFGFFGTTSWSGANLTLVTTQRMPHRLRQQWIGEGRISPYAGLSVFAPPRDYLVRFGELRGVRYPWPGSNALWRRSVRAANYNHGLFLDVNRQRRRDALALIGQQPAAYARTVLFENLPAFFSSSTHWHPRDGKAGAPHEQHRRVLGGYERLFDRWVHGWPTRGVGVYWLCLPMFLWGGVRLLRAWSPWKVRTRPLSGADRLLLLCMLQVGFVTSVSVLMTAQESARYRFVVEPCLVAIAALVGLRCTRAVQRVWPARRLR